MKGKLSTKEISELLGISQKTVFRALSSFSPECLNRNPKELVALMDATYWGRKFGVVTIKDHLSGHIYWFKFIDRKERIDDYVEGIHYLEESGCKTLAVVSDGLKGLRKRLLRFPYQYCQFHQLLRVEALLTQHPKLQASQEFLDLIYFMFRTDKASFVGLFGECECKWKIFLSERAVGSDGRSHYVHKNLRSAYLSVKRNMQVLWTYEDYYELNIPNTNNELESLFTGIKKKLGNHSGLSVERRKALISRLLIVHNPRNIRD